MFAIPIAKRKQSATYITKKNPMAINITPANFIPAKFAPYKTMSSAVLIVK